MKIFQVALLIPVSLWVNAQIKTPLFRLLPSASSGVSFANNIFENDSLNILNQANIYNGSGHGDLIPGKHRQLFYVFHMHNSDSSVAPRKTGIISMHFKRKNKGDTVFEVDNKSFRYLKKVK